MTLLAAAPVHIDGSIAAVYAGLAILALGLFVMLVRWRQALFALWALASFAMLCSFFVVWAIDGHLG